MPVFDHHGGEPLREDVDRSAVSADLSVEERVLDGREAAAAVGFQQDEPEPAKRCEIRAHARAQRRRGGRTV